MRYTTYTETHTEPLGHQYHFKTVPCPRCGETAVISVFGKDLYRYNQGAPTSSRPSLTSRLPIASD